MAGTGWEHGDGLASEGGGDLTRSAADGTPGDEGDLRASVSVVVGTRNRSGLLPPLLGRLLSDPATAEVVVVADAPEDDTVEVAGLIAREDSRVRIISVDHRSQMRTLAAGVEASVSDIVLLVDDDVLPGEGLVSGHARRHRARPGERLVVVGYMPVAERFLTTPGTRLYAAEYESGCLQIESGTIDVLEALWAGNLSLRRADALAVGLASDRYRAFYHGDRDLGYRLADAGLTGVFDRSLASEHLHRRDRSAWLRDAASQGGGLALLCRVHPERMAAVDLDGLDDDLPAPLRLVVSRAGESRWATEVATVLYRLGALAGRAGLRRGELPPVRLARRVMRRHGIVTERRGDLAGGGADAEPSADHSTETSPAPH